MQFIDLKTQQAAIRADIDKRIAAVLGHGQYILGPEVTEMEQVLERYVGTKHGVAMASGTDALLVALMALGIGPGDEVITSAFTFVASGEVIVLTGATPVFADVEPNTANIDPASIEAKITSRTKAIMPVSLYGQVPDMDAINAIAARHNLPVIEDAAQSFGATYKGRRSCGLSTIGCTSFFPSKPLGCYGDGGAFFTDDDDLAQAAREIRVHGQSERYIHTRIGIGGRMDSIQCAVILAKWPRFEWEVGQRERIGRRYSEEILQKVPGAVALTKGSNLAELDAPVAVLEIGPSTSSVYAQYTVLLKDRAAVQEYFAAAGIPTAVHYPMPLGSQPAYSKWAPDADTPVADAFAAGVMSLPMSADLTEDDQDRVIDCLRRALGS
ncbi:DegT/DnrJ/EryC1/StrS aminotransferase family protein [Tsuneonella sp. YG55]|uniref:DegT/DnrJ/EryC1/StrS aminotransferase family protein n=1 Tax=Tsuneonella litorea TaxID=2976475 RepID=A0A9X3AM32_9SPHN|nr:DegT/DnrJ/EryC1/StrS aminotransferase family protein [Tsuneonella litorea]MCT2557792.1 DegT/DnrJ/EryC1/StrS aminotransferase family protein [Tsuneonella litorea]